MTDRRPVVRAPDAAWRRLGELLQLRRAELGYQRRPAFTRAAGINIRLVTDIENAYRPNTFLTPTLREIARAYQVSYDSLIAVLLGHDDGLIAVTPDRLAAAPDGWQPPIADRARRDAAAPYAVPIMERLLDLADDGIIDPSGAQVFLGDEGHPLPSPIGSPADVMAWDGIGRRMPPRDRAWFIGDLRRWEAARGGNSGTGATGALGARLRGVLMRV
jgi:hypothetical protein